ncbi:MAG: HlyD family efflux transporter periplasmic adaptor subunit [Chloroflexi bacterium]|nr:HlyD family efflux transporter periplasmic adaptor subunit [Chloroflexota bacterium]
MSVRLRGWRSGWQAIWLLTVLLAVTLVTAGCTELAEDYPTPTPLPTPAESNKPVYEAVRGSIVQSVKGLGRVAASQEATLYFRQSGRLSKLYVETGAKVKEGDLLAELDTATLKTRLAQAKVNTEVAELRLAQAADRSSSDSDVAAAAAALARTEADHARAVAQLEQLKRGATAADLSAADQAVVKAEADLRAAENALAKLKAGPTEDAIRAAELAVEKARNDRWGAQIDRDRNCGAQPKTATCVRYEASLAAVQTVLDRALVELDRLKSGPRQEDVDASEKNVASARAALATARARQQQLIGGPKMIDVEAAERSVVSARAAVDAARSQWQLKLNIAAKGGDYDIQIQKKQVELARLTLEELQAQLALAQIKAPFAGIVVFVTSSREGEVANAYTPVVTIADPKSFQVAIELSPADLTKVKLDQEAQIIFTAYPTQKYPAKILKVPATTQSNEPQLASDQRTVRLNIDAPPEIVKTLELGDLVNVSIATLKKDDVLILPNTAIRTFGGRRFVRLTGEGRLKKEVDIEIGISDEAMTEITKGLKEGQRVIAP